MIVFPSKPAPTGIADGAADPEVDSPGASSYLYRSPLRAHMTRDPSARSTTLPLSEARQTAPIAGFNGGAVEDEAGRLSGAAVVAGIVAVVEAVVTVGAVVAAGAVVVVGAEVVVGRVVKAGSVVRGFGATVGGIVIRALVDGGSDGASGAVATGVGTAAEGSATVEGSVPTSGSGFGARLTRGIDVLGVVDGRGRRVVVGPSVVVGASVVVGKVDGGAIRSATTSMGSWGVVESGARADPTVAPSPLHAASRTVREPARTSELRRTTDSPTRAATSSPVPHVDEGQHTRASSVRPKPTKAIREAQTPPSIVGHELARGATFRPTSRYLRSRVTAYFARTAPGESLGATTTSAEPSPNSALLHVGTEPRQRTAAA